MARALALLASLAASVAPLPAQTHLERTPHLDGGWLGLPGMAWLEHRLLARTTPATGDGLSVTPTYRGALALPAGLLVGGALAPDVRPGGGDVLEAFARVGRRPGAEDRWGLGVTVGYTDPAGSLDGELSAWKALGPVRLLAAARGYTDLDGRGAAAAVLGGAVLPVAPGRVPVVLAGDLGRAVGDGGRGELLWSAGLHAGVPFTPFTVALEAGNARDPGLQGSVVDAGRVRFGAGVVAPVPLGRFLGWYAPRPVAVRSVEGDVGPGPDAVRVSISAYAYWPLRLEVPAGTVVEWVNEDGALHTVSADDGTFESGGLPRGASWRARFDEPGTFPYHCGPHPFMQAVVVVR